MPKLHEKLLETFQRNISELDTFLAYYNNSQSNQIVLFF